MHELISDDFSLVLDQQKIASSKTSLYELFSSHSQPVFNAQRIRDARFPKTGNLLKIRCDLPLPELNGKCCESEMSFLFSDTSTLLLKIRSIHIATKKSKQTPMATADHQGSRLLCVNHRWHTLVEDPNRTPEPFKEIISDNCSLRFPKIEHINVHFAVPFTVID